MNGADQPRITANEPVSVTLGNCNGPFAHLLFTGKGVSYNERS